MLETVGLLEIWKGLSRTIKTNNIAGVGIGKMTKPKSLH